MGKGGGGSAHTPTEAPNTLQSRATARIIDLLSEGEVDGVVGGLKGIYLDNTPIQNDDGSFNFSNLIIDLRAGLPDQPSIQGFPAVEAVFGVGTEVKQSAAVVRAIANPEATAALVTIRLDGLQTVSTSTGDINPTSVQIAIDVQLDGGVFTDVTPANSVFTGKTSSAYQRSFRITRPGPGNWSIRVRRITADNSSSTLTNKTFWDSVTEIEDFQLQYPHSALAAYQVDAQSFGGNIPTRLVRLRGLKTRIPSNYDPIARTYTGIWDGTFKTAWHNNPAWVLFEFIANDRWGLGEYVPDAFRDKWTLYSIGQYCDEMVPDGLGGFEPRYTFNFGIATADDALKVLMSIASVFRGMIYWGSAGVTASADRPLDPIKLVVPANVIGGIINWGGGSLKARHTVAIVTWYNPDNFCQPDFEVVEGSPADIARFGYRTMEVVAIGCTSRGQAHRMGRWAIETEKSEAESCNWQAAWDHSDVYPGDIVEVQDPAYAGVEFGGRVAGLVDIGGAIKGLILDRPIVLEEGKSYELSVTLADGTVATRAVTTAAETTSTLDFIEALTPPPIINAVWVLTSSDVAPRRVKVIKRVENKNIYDLSGILHDPTKFDRIEQYLVLEPPSYTSLPLGPLTPPSAVSASECITLISGAVRTKIVLSWVLSTDPRVINYEVQVRPPEQNFQPASPQFSTTTSIDLLDLPSGNWQFRVRGIDAVGRVSSWVYSAEAIELDGLNLPPDPVTNLRNTYITGRSNLIWDNPDEFRTFAIEIRKGTSFESAQIVSDNAMSPWQTVGDDTYFVASYITTSAGLRVYSSTIPSILIEDSVALENVVVSNDERAEGWTGYFYGTVQKDSTGGNFLRTSGQDAFLAPPDFLSPLDFLNRGLQGGGYYWSKRVVNIGQKGLCRISNDWTATGVPVNGDFLAGEDFLFPPDFLSGFLSQYIRVRPVIRISDTGPGDAYDETNIFAPDDVFLAGTNWKPVQIWSPDVYSGWLFQLGMQFEILSSAAVPDPGVIAYLLSWKWTVDVPDRLDSYQNLDIPVGGLPIIFRPTGSQVDRPFNGGLNNEPLPHVTTSIQNPTPGDLVVFEDLSLSGMRIFVVNAGVKVARTGKNVAALVRGY